MVSALAAGRHAAGRTWSSREQADEASPRRVSLTPPVLAPRLASWTTRQALMAPRKPQMAAELDQSLPSSAGPGEAQPRSGWASSSACHCSLSRASRPLPWGPSPTAWHGWPQSSLCTRTPSRAPHVDVHEARSAARARWAIACCIDVGALELSLLLQLQLLLLLLLLLHLTNTLSQPSVDS